MKRKVLVLILLGVLITGLKAENLKAYLSYSAFNTPENIPYLETYLTVKGSSVSHILSDDGYYQGVLEIQIIFKKNDSIVNFAKYELAGPQIKDTLMGMANFLDVQRFSLGNGDFDIELKIKDKNSETEALNSFHEYTIDFPDEGSKFSDIELLKSYEKSNDNDNLSRNGFRLVPYVFNFYPEQESSISFYAELYNKNIDETNNAFLLSYYIRPFEIDTRMDKYSYSKRKTATDVNPILGSFDIKDLPSGNYLLVFEARNRNNEIISQNEAYFQRDNPNLEFDVQYLNSVDYSNTFVKYINSHDTLAMYISWLKPISTDVEAAFARSLTKPDSDLEEMKKYFLTFWVDRDKVFPLEAWLQYKAYAEKADYNYSTQNTSGFDTDRGRVFLQYGPPNAIAERHNEPNAFPYEIWHYYELPNGQKDKKFVFYTQEIATNDFELIHSNAIGELNNYKWRIWINSRDARYTNTLNVDDTHYREIWGGEQDDYYYQPR